MGVANRVLKFTTTAPNTWTDWQLFALCHRWSVKNCNGKLILDVDTYGQQPQVVCGQQEEVKRGFMRLRIQSSQAEDVYISVGDDITTDSRKQVDTSGGGIDTATQTQNQMGTAQGPAAVTVQPGQSSGLILYQTAGSHRLVLSLQPGSPGPVRVGNSNTPVDGGIWLWPEQQLPIEAGTDQGGGNAEVFIFNPAENLVPITVCGILEAN